MSNQDEKKPTLYNLGYLWDTCGEDLGVYTAADIDPLLARIADLEVEVAQGRIPAESKWPLMAGLAKKDARIAELEGALTEALERAEDGEKVPESWLAGWRRILGK